VAKNIYGAASISFAAPAKKKLQMIKELGYEHFPICIAKTQFSFSTDAKQYCVASGFDVNVRDIVINAGAEMIVVVAGSIMRMPGLPKVPAAMNIDIVNGEIEGLS
jgi:formate--tetrahydrofolate ligase